MLSDEAFKITTDLSNVDMEKLNEREKIGLFFIGELSTTKLVQLLGLEYEEVEDMLSDIYDLIRNYDK